MYHSKSFAGRSQLSAQEKAVDHVRAALSGSFRLALLTLWFMHRHRIDGTMGYTELNRFDDLCVGMSILVPRRSLQRLPYQPKRMIKGRDERPGTIFNLRILIHGPHAGQINPFPFFS